MTYMMSYDEFKTKWKFSSWYSKKFVDTVRILVKGGSGGMGLPKFKGIGGNGGSVVVKATKEAKLIQVQKMYSKGIITAESGKNSHKHRIFGSHGADKIINVPIGVTVYDQYMRKMGELNQEGDQLVVAEGGPGGTEKCEPAYSGSQGFSQAITIDLKLIADVGLVGFPNAGKSTLLKSISRAKPKIAAYAFTTLRPNIGILEYPDFRKIQMADLPGLIEGASHNLGMGHKFLKHVERSSLLLMLVDINGFQLTPHCKHRSCLETIIILNKELELYNSDLLDKPAILVINKMDLPGAVSTFRDIKPYLKDLQGYSSQCPEEIRPTKFLNFDLVLPISAAYDPESVAVLKNAIRKTLDRHFELSLIDTMTKEDMELLKKAKKENEELTKIQI